MLLQIILSYVVLIFVFYFILVEKIKMINTVIIASSPRKRSILIKELKEAKSDIILSVFWPLLLIREARDAVKNKK